MRDAWPWVALAGLGAFHGLNPAMGWLFAVALALHRGSRAMLARALLPIGLGHVASVAVVAALVVGLGAVVMGHQLARAAGLVLLLWAVWHWRWGHRRRLPIGMGVGMAGLALWSFFMATAHGAGLMLVPLLMPLCLAASPGADIMSTDALAVGLAATLVHGGTALLTTGIVAWAVYHWIGLGVLRRGWINLDLLWSAALFVVGLTLIF